MSISRSDRSEEALIVVREESFREGTGWRGFTELVCDVEDPGDEFRREGGEVVVGLRKGNHQCTSRSTVGRKATLRGKS